MIEVIVTTTNAVVTSSEITQPVTVTADNVLFTVTSVVNNFTVTSITPEITFSTEGFGFDFATKHLGEWVSGNTYVRNDVVRYNYSIYICQIQSNQTLVSTTPPPNDTASWELFIDNLWPKSRFTVTEQLTVLGGSTFVNATVTNNLTVRGVSSLQTATVSDFYINSLRYPNNTGNYGQVLSTNGVNQASWVNLGDLVFWNLSSDLQTNGFNIVTGAETGVPNPQLTIGSGDTGSFISYIRLEQGSGNITLNGPRVLLQESDSNAKVDVSGGDVTISGDLVVNNNQYLRGKLYGDDQTTFAEIGYGIVFPDGTYMTSTNILIGSSGTFSVPIASASRLGVIRVGQYLTIDPDTGILSVDQNALPPNYVLPAASTTVRGGIRVGNGLTISQGDILNVSTSSAFGNVSLTEDMITNGYLIKHSNNTTSGQLYLESEKASLRVGSTGPNKVVIDNTSLKVEHSALVDLKAPNVRVGSDIYNSDLQVSRIYNYSGVGPPFFPAGIQFGDNTVQLTAYIPDDMGPIIGGRMFAAGVDFNNLTFAVDYNL